MLILLFILLIVVTGIFARGGRINYLDPFVELSMGIVILFLAVASFKCVSGRTIADKIAMYEAENINIEQQIDILVAQYMKYEQDTYSELKGDSSIDLVTLYPELKADELVQRQYSTYLENNNKIKELKEEQIDLKVYRWMLYFG